MDAKHQEKLKTVMVMTSDGDFGIVSQCNVLTRLNKGTKYGNWMHNLKSSPGIESSLLSLLIFALQTSRALLNEEKVLAGLTSSFA